MKEPPKHLAYKYVDERVHPARWDLFFGETMMEKQRSFLCWMEKRYPEWTKKQNLRVGEIQFRNWQIKCMAQDRLARSH